MQEIHIQCPYCLQAISILLDTGVYGHETVVDDCEVCCRPIEISYIVEDGEIKTYSYNSIKRKEFKKKKSQSYLCVFEIFVVHPLLRELQKII